MDPRSHPSRPPSASLPTSLSQGSTPLSSTPISSMPMPQYAMQHHYPVSQPHTLPPLQPHHSQSPAPHQYMAQSYRADLSRYPTTSAHEVYATSAAPIMPHTTVGSMQPSFLAHANPQAQMQHGYPSPHGMMPASTSAQTYPQPIAPAPPRDRRPDFAGMPSGAFSYPDGKTAAWVTPETVAAANGAAPFVGKDAARAPMVGAQGRRGILPSVAGGRAAPAGATNGNGTNGTAKSTTIPQKDADGKFPCPHCNKTYLHAKHLKRHLLRHTGDRPYMCVLCKDTFSRSDILKRHFQKCSIRRGNPTGATHLSHPNAHLKRNQNNAAKNAQNDVSTSMAPSNGIVGAPSFGDGTVNGNGLAAGRTGYPDQQSMAYAMPTVNGLPTAHGMPRGHPDDAFAAQQHQQQQHQQHQQQQQQQQQRASWMAASKQHPYLMQGGTDASGQPLGVDRHEQPGAPDGYINPVFPQSMATGQDSIHAHVDPDRKYYPATTAGHQENGMNGLYLASSTLAGDGTVQSAKQ